MARFIRRLGGVIAIQVVINAGLVGLAAGTTIDFEGLGNGLAGPFGLSGVTISGSGPNLGSAIFDSDPLGPNAAAEDQDLLVNTGKVLILQDSLEPGISGGIYLSPDDDADGGTLSFVFSAAATLLSIDLIDINRNGPATLTLSDGSAKSRVYEVPFFWTGDIAVGDVGIQTLDLTTLLDQVGVGPGNPLATASQDPGFDPTNVVGLDVFFAGSAALDTLVFLPEPGILTLLALGLAGLAFVRRGQP